MAPNVLGLPVSADNPSPGDREPHYQLLWQRYISMRKLLPLLIACLTLSAVAVLAHAQTKEQKDFEKQQKEFIKEYIKAHGDMVPQRTFEAPAEKIKPLLTFIMTQENYVMDSESPSQLVFSQDMTGTRVELGKMFGAMGGEASTGNPRRVLPIRLLFSCRP